MGQSRRRPGGFLTGSSDKEKAPVLETGALKAGYEFEGAGEGAEPGGRQRQPPTPPSSIRVMDEDSARATRCSTVSTYDSS